jgi:hypothetical protein
MGKAKKIKKQPKDEPLKIHGSCEDVLKLSGNPAQKKKDKKK